MHEHNCIVVVGLGEVGRPIRDLFSQQYKVIGVDVLPPSEEIGHVDVLHICYPFEIPDFVGESVRYIRMYKPELVIINSTVGVGTTRAVAERSGCQVVNSPVRGKHVNMLEELRYYTKFIGVMNPDAGQRAAEHFRSVGVNTKVLQSPEATELAKLTETTYFGLMIAWAQEVERHCDSLGVDYDEVISFYEQIKFFPSVKYFPGVIGGHCVMPNIKILKKIGPSPLLEGIELSNSLKVKREERMTAAEPALATP